MELVNRTPVPARLHLFAAEDPSVRAGLLVAKATLRIEASGKTALETEDPLPLLEEDQETPLGLLPRDDLYGTSDDVEIILLGTAHAPGGRATARMTVALQVGEVRRELVVSGDRFWQGERGGEGISEPVPFLRMPLTWARAFGGTCDVQIDEGSVLAVSHPLNPEGRGMDPEAQASKLGELLRVPEGYPLWDRRRPLPNLERSEELYSKWEDDFPPACWATVPLFSALVFHRSILAIQQASSGSGLEADPEELMPLAQQGLQDICRACPDWAIPRPPPGAEVVTEGVVPQGSLRFTLPHLRVACDQVVGERSWTSELVLRRIILLPEQMRLCLVHVHRFTVDFSPGEERSIRLRLEQGASGGGAGSR